MVQLINIIGNKLLPKPFQNKIIKKVENENSVLLTMPTNSGKTLVAYSYANLDDTNPDNRIIFTSPTKSLSNERYAELVKQGLPADLITGDVRMDNRNPIICMTQEIYQNEYFANKSTIIIDEFHYIIHNRDRARAYIESIAKTNKDSKIMLMSATLDKPEELALWLNNLTGRNFISASSNQRLVPLQFDKKGIECKDIKNAIVFCFSIRNINRVIDKIIETRHKINKRTIKTIEELANKYNVQYMEPWFYGVSGYYGKLLPKEKDFIVYLYRNGYIDTVTGTDSLALGVNLPCQYVVIAEVYKPTDEKLKPSEFLQLCGRAGRYGQENVGIATYLKDTPLNYHNGIKYRIDNEFKGFVSRGLEKTRIDVDVDYKSLLNGKYLEEEIEDLVRFTYNSKSENILTEKTNVVNNANKEIKNLFNEYNDMMDKQHSQLYTDMLTNYYLQEWPLDVNGYMAFIASGMIADNGCIDTKSLINKVRLENKMPGVFVYELLLVNKWLKAIRLDEKYRIKDYGSLIEAVNDLDITIFNPNERLI